MSGTQTSKRSSEHVILVHGIGVPSLVMSPLAKQMRSRDYQVYNFGYNSLIGSIKRHGRRLRSHLRAIRHQDEEARIYIVGHSMGAIVTRYAVGRHRSLVDRIAFLTAPHHGSRVASFFAPAVSWFLPMVGELRRRESSFVNCLGQPRVPFINIAATWDWLIDAETSHLDNELQHTELPTFHSGVLFGDQVPTMIDEFFRECE